MGLEVALILFGIIGQAASNSGTKLHHVAHVCLEVGIGIAVVEAALVLLSVLGISRVGR